MHNKTLAQMCRTYQELKSQEIAESSSLGNSKRISLKKQPPIESMRSPVSDGSRRNSMDRIGDLFGSKRITEPSSKKIQSKSVNSFGEVEKVIRIEES